MPQLIEKPFEDFNRITDLSNKVAKSGQNFTAARTVIRDYVINMDEKYYAQVEQRIALALEELAQAELLADGDDMRSSIHGLRDSIHAWGAIARQVRDAFDAYQDKDQRTVLADFFTLIETGTVLARSGAAPDLMCDVQAAHKAIIGFFISGDDKLMQESHRAMSSAKEKIEKAGQNNSEANLSLQAFASTLETCAGSLREAVVHRRNAYHLLQENLSPLGIQVQAAAEQFHHQLIDQQWKRSVLDMSLLAELRHAVEHDELVLYYQPKMELSTGIIRHAEALVRWIHPKRGLIRPDQFIPFAEHTGFITAITRWAFDKAIQQCAEWQKKGLSMNVSINISARDLLDPHLPSSVANRLAALDVSPQWLTLEITESAIMGDPIHSEKVLQAFRGMGVQLSIDDFGTGHSSLTYLKKIRAHELKIDKSFVMDLIVDEHDVMIVRSTIELGHNMGLKIVAEGVENADTRDLLKELGCDFVQGYYISGPLSSDQIEQWLQESVAPGLPNFR